MPKEGDSLKKILFITWDGVPGTYLEGLFLSIFKELIKRGYIVKILQFTWAEEGTLMPLKRKLNHYNIYYEYIIIKRGWPLKSGYLVSFLAGARRIREIITNERYNLIMPRSILPSLILLLSKVQDHNIRIVYDSDGFPHDERVDFQGWSSKGIPYKFYRFIERRIIHNSYSIITRSKKAKQILVERGGKGIDGKKIFVVHNGRDEEVFSIKQNLSIQKLFKEFKSNPEKLILIYIGSLGEKYLVKELLLFFDYIQKKRTTEIIFLTSNTKLIFENIKKLKVDAFNITVKQVEPEEVCNYLNIADVGLFFCKKTFSTLSVFPTKVSEYLLSGLPAIISKDIGDCNELAENNESVYLLSDYDDNSFENVLTWIDKIKNDFKLRQQAREFALERLTAGKTADEITKAFCIT
jgi:glycosyltransferase involved in cell wall biosynthesis